MRHQIQKCRPGNLWIQAPQGAKLEFQLDYALAYVQILNRFK